MWNTRQRPVCISSECWNLASSPFRIDNCMPPLCRLYLCDSCHLEGGSLLSCSIQRLIRHTAKRARLTECYPFSLLSDWGWLVGVYKPPFYLFSVWSETPLTPCHFRFTIPFDQVSADLGCRSPLATQTQQGPAFSFWANKSFVICLFYGIVPA